MASPGQSTAPSGRGISTPFSLNDANTTINAYNCLYDRADSVGATCTGTDSDNRTTPANFWSVYDKYEKVMAASPAAIPAAKTNARADLKKAYEEILGKITRYDDPSPSDYSNDLVKLRDEVKATRDTYDEKLASILKLKDSGYDEYKSHYESTLMSGILWGTLAGTIIYYVFYK